MRKNGQQVICALLRLEDGTEVHVEADELEQLVQQQEDNAKG